MTFRKRLYLTLDPSEKGGLPERIFEIVLISIIALNMLAIVLESVQEIRENYHYIFSEFEIFSITFFAVEYVARIYSIVEDEKFSHPVKGRLRFMRTPLSIVDLLAFLPFFITLLPIDLRFLRVFRLMALFRLLKLARYLHAMSIFKRVLADRKEQLLLSFLFIIFILVIMSFVMFYAEHAAQPDQFSSIPATMWWGVATLTTVGYGDIVPITPIGKIIGGLFAIAGVGLLALPAGILSSGFFEQLHSNTRKCPHCGKDIHE